MTITGIFNSLGQAILDNLAIPVIVLFGAAFIAMIKPRIDKFVQSMIARADMKELMEENTVRKELIELIDGQVRSAVAANMSMAFSIKKRNGGVIPDEDAQRLANSARTTVMNSLPTTLTMPDGSLNQVIGGSDRLESIIQSAMEKYIYEYKYGDNRNALIAVDIPGTQPAPQVLEAQTPPVQPQTTASTSQPNTVSLMDLLK